MAKLSSDGTYVLVQKNDTLWGISEEYLGDPTRYRQLAAWNGISNPDYIVVGQHIQLSNGASSNEPAAPSPTITTFGLLSTSDDTLIATWTWSKESQTESYKVLWSYTTLDGMTLVGSSESISVDEDAYAASRQSEYTIPSGAAYVHFKVKPIAKSRNSGSESRYFTASWSEEKKYTVATPLEVPSGLSIKLDGLKLTAEVSGVKSPANKVQFQLYKNNVKHVSSKNAKVANSATGYASYAWNNLDEGATYTVRCRAVKDKIYSEWSAFSSEVQTRPAAPSGILSCKAIDETTAYLEWPASDTAESYKIQYTTNKDYFDKSSNVTEITTESTAYYVTGMTSGNEYFFRVKAVGANNQESEWTELVSIVIGASPAAPTTWSSTTTAIVGEIVKLYWVHNSEDGSSETYADIELIFGSYIDGVFVEDETIRLPDVIIENTATEDEKDNTKYYEFDTTSYAEGTVLQWRVRTAGITNTFGDWSTKRTVDIHAQPTLSLSVKNDPSDAESITEITTFPFHILAVPGPKTQTPIGYHVSITADESYETVDAIGNVVIVNAGEEIYSKFYSINYDLEAVMSAGDIDLEKNINYTIAVMVTMDSGLTVEDSVTLPVTWSEIMYSPNADISVDTDDYTAYIRPYCENRVTAYYEVAKEGNIYILTTTNLGFVYRSMIFYKVEYSSGIYTATTEVVDCAPGKPVSGAYVNGNNQVYCGTDTNGLVVYYYKVDPTAGIYTATGEKVHYGIDSNGNTVYFSEVEEATALEDVELAVYRREFDGGFTEIASGIDGSRYTTVTDPHPALDYARYRIVATSTTTGSVGYYDLPNYPVGGKEVVIQWNETWTSFEIEDGEELVEPPWTGSLLKLPYNIDVSDSHSPDVSLVEYIGRAHPVSYYGTHRGVSSTWNVEIDKSDKETLYALRRLANWMGDVYVREPSGSSYWANITVSFSQKHREVTIPVTLSINRVEGGI